MAVWPSDSIRTKNWGTEILTDADLEAQLDLLHAYFQASLNSSTGHTHSGTSNDGPKVPLTSLTIGSQAQGDVIYASSASAWARLGAGTAGQVLKTGGAAANPSWSNVAPNHYRRELLCSQASSTTITVGLGELDVNGTIITKTSATTLTISTAGDYAGGASLRATSTYGYVGVDTSGNIKMHTTAPSHSDYALSSTSGIKRYVSWSSTTYRVIGWFYMNSTGSGELFSYEVGNIKDGGIPNVCYASSASSVNSSSTSAVSDTNALIHAYSSGRPVRIIYSVASATGTNDNVAIQISLDGSGDTDTERWAQTKTTTTFKYGVATEKISTPAQGTRTVQGQYFVDSGTGYINKRSVSFEEL